MIPLIMLRMKASDPGYSEISHLWNLYAITINPQAWMNRVDMDEIELNVLRSTLVDFMTDALEMPPAFMQYVSSEAESWENID